METPYKHIFVPEEMKAFLKVQSVCAKLACVSAAKPVELIIEDLK
jgi:hypothetical protein